MEASRRRGAVAAVLCAVLTAGISAGPAQAGPGAGASAPRAGKAIVGGTIADISSWPFQVAIMRKGKLHCGGSVIAPTKVLTAAHCVLGFGVTQLSVVIGRKTLSDGGSGEVIPVASSAAHPDYADTRRHDVGVLTLGFATSAPPLALPTPEQSAAATVPGALTRVAGWGARNPLGFALSGTLRKTTERIRANKRCRRSYRSFFSGAAMLCTLGKRLHRYKRVPIHTTACSGDSGGPLVSDAFGSPVAVGTVSYGSSICGYAGSPTVYARVSDSLAFIQGAL